MASFMAVTPGRRATVSVSGGIELSRRYLRTSSVSTSLRSVICTLKKLCFCRFRTRTFHVLRDSSLI